jgi:recombination associated protein RdgC
VEIIMLWFKNLMVYRLSRDVSLRAEEMEKQLAAYTFTPCGSQDMAKTGWVPPMGSHSDALTHASSTARSLSARVKKRNPAVAGDQAGAGSENLQAGSRSGPQAEKTEKDSLKDEVLHSLLPRAFSRFSQTMMWIDTVNGLIMVDCASAKRKIRWPCCVKASALCRSFRWRWKRRSS